MLTNDGINFEELREKAEEELEGAKREQSEARASLETLRAERDALVKEVADLREKANDELEGLQREQSDVRASLETLRAERDALVKEVADLREETPAADDESSTPGDELAAGSTEG